ncbi:hypothetical protein [Herbiconiux sp. L3-i23]|uniref:hypothetical protein n=1 Tax=Herbiconiux sp. L3-i23 TaxID=2905871 RepID=UPI0020564536|nr:hypothetical protein [Herbiconiux sp. L3-i23]BDI21738.1 hypothetical protein L3i23_05140 [Herbiconiux sp. L3-i23]
MRKYLLNGSIISAVVSSISTIRTGQAGPKDWRFYLSVVASLLTLAVAVGTVRAESFEQASED